MGKSKRSIDFYGADTFNSMIQHMNNDWFDDCYEFVYKGEVYQIVRDGGRVDSRYDAKINVYWLSGYVTNNIQDKIYYKDSKSYPGHDIKTVFSKYILFDGVKLYDALMNGDIEWNM